MAVAALIAWIIYVASKTKAFAWTSFGLLVILALLGFAMLRRWLPAYRGRVRACSR